MPQCLALPHLPPPILLSRQTKGDIRLIAAARWRRRYFVLWTPKPPYDQKNSLLMYFEDEIACQRFFSAATVQHIVTLHALPTAAADEGSGLAESRGPAVDGGREEAKLQGSTGDTTTTTGEEDAAAAEEEEESDPRGSGISRSSPRQAGAPRPTTARTVDPTAAEDKTGTGPASPTRSAGLGWRPASLRKAAPPTPFAAVEDLLLGSVNLSSLAFFQESYRLDLSHRAMELKTAHRTWVLQVTTSAVSRPSGGCRGGKGQGGSSSSCCRGGDEGRRNVHDNSRVPLTAIVPSAGRGRGGLLPVVHGHLACPCAVQQHHGLGSRRLLLASTCVRTALSASEQQMLPLHCSAARPLRSS